MRYGAVNPKYIKSAMLYHLRPILEKWSNTKLVNNIGVYGIRRYLRGSTLTFHVDRLPTHIISAILQVLPMVGITHQNLTKVLRHS